MAHRHLVSVALTLSVAASPGLAQESKAVFDAPIAVVPGDNRIEHLVDFDGDGWMDLLSWWRVSINSGDIQVRGWRNEAGAGFTQIWEVTLGGQGVFGDGRLAVGDIDGDGDLDFAAEFRQQVRVYACDGLNDPTVVNTKNLPAQVADMAFVDFDNNGFADLVVRESNGTLRIHKNGGPAAGWAQPLVSTTTLLPEASRMQVAELSGDGVDDLLFVVPYVIQIVRLQSDGTIAGSSFFLTASAWPSPRPAIGDLDGDGDDDVVVWDGAAPNGYYEILRRDGPSNWTLEPVRAGGPATKLADIDLDGDLDGICCGGGGGGDTWLNGIESTFNICHNQGGGVFTPSFQMRGVGSKHIAGANDIDHDGDVDLIAGRAIYYPRGMLTAGPGLVLPAPLAFESGLVDFDDDGDRDLNLDVASVLRSNGQYEFSSVAPRLPAAPAGSTYHGPGYTGDFDGDGDEDWIVARADGGVFAQMELMRNLGDGTFVYGGAAGPSGVSFSLDLPLQFDPRSYFTGDVDSDGDLDLLTRAMPTITASWRTRVWLNNGSGMFSAGVNMFSTSVMALAHLNADAHLDLVLAFNNAFTQTLGVAFGAGNGTFPTGGLLPATAEHRTAGPHETLAVLDIDADGDMDIAAVAQPSSGWGLLRRWTNNGSGVFTEAFTNDNHYCHTFGTPTTTAHVLADDVNGDGFDDLVLWPAKEGKSGAWILLRSSSGVGFEPSLLQGVQPLALDDVDSDGDADVIGRGPSGLDNMRVLSRAIEGPAVGARRQYGEGTGAPGGCVPLIGAVGPFRVGSTMQLRMRGGVGGATGYIALSMLEAATPDTPFPGMTRYVGLPMRKLPIKLDGPLGVPCAGEKTRQFVIPPSYAGRTFFHQLVLNDASAPNGVVCSNGLEISYD